MKIRAWFWFSLWALVLSASTLTAQGSWEVVGTGIEYRKYTLSHPNNVFVTRMDRTNTLATLESSIGQGRLTGGTETVLGMFNRYEQVLNFSDPSWGSRNDVVVAINGDFYNTSTGVPTSGQIHSGWYAKRFSKLTGGSGFAWKMDRSAFIGRCVNHPSAKQFVTYVATGATQKFQGINVARGADQLVIYTPQYDSDTNTNSSGVEVLVELVKPMLIEPTPSMVTGVVKKIRNGQGSTPIPFDHVVLSATGTARTTLLANVAVGDEIGISQEIKHFEQDCSTKLNTLDWTKTYASVGGSFVFLENGVVPSFTDPGATARHPRTAICFNASYIYFIVVGPAPSDGDLFQRQLHLLHCGGRAESWGERGDVDGGAGGILTGHIGCRLVHQPRRRRLLDHGGQRGREEQALGRKPAPGGERDDDGSGRADRAIDDFGSE
jgi:hypothetical protein